MVHAVSHWCSEMSGAADGLTAAPVTVALAHLPAGISEVRRRFFTTRKVTPPGAWLASGDVIPNRTLANPCASNGQVDFARPVAEITHDPHAAAPPSSPTAAIAARHKSRLDDHNRPPQAAMLSAATPNVTNSQSVASFNIASICVFAGRHGDGLLCLVAQVVFVPVQQVIDQHVVRDALAGSNRQ